MSAAARRFVLTLALAAIPLTASAQATLQPTAPPLVTASNEAWFAAGAPIVWSGDYYYPAGAPLHFRAHEMVRAGSFRGIPLYTNPTVDPYGIVYVPLDGGLMQPYQRRRTGELAGTTGSTTPAFPPAVATDMNEREPAAGVVQPDDLRQAPGPPMYQRPYDVSDSGATSESLPRPVATSGAVPAPAGPAGPTETAIEPEGINAIWIEFDGRRWYADGMALTLSQEPFTEIGTYHGVPVYRWKDDPSRIYVTSVPGAVSPYALKKPKLSGTTGKSKR